MPERSAGEEGLSPEQRTARLLRGAACEVSSHDAPGSYFCEECGRSAFNEIADALRAAQADAERRAFEEAVEAAEALREPCFDTHVKCGCSDCYWKRSKWGILDKAAEAIRARAAASRQGGEGEEKE